jgi:hypothetical protein
MQPKVNSMNPNMTSNEVDALIILPDLMLTNGLELLRPDLSLIADISDGFVSGTISRGNFDVIHGKCELVIDTEMDWGTALLRPYIVLSGYQGSHIPGEDIFLSARYNLGVYYTSTPSYIAGQVPRRYTVQGYDQLQGLISPVGNSVQINAGVSYILAIRTILEDQGYFNHQIDNTRYSTLTITPKVWPIDENTTWLAILNDLLAAIGYRGLWVDWDGQFRSEPYTSPAYRPTEWAYDTDVNDTILLSRSRSIDYFDAPNRWIAVRSSMDDGVIPVEGAGVYTYVNQSTGLTSVDARGRTISKLISIDAVDQAALVASANVTIDADLRIDQNFEVTTGPNPLHWHFDRLTLIDDEFGQPVDVQETEWSLPLDGTAMSHKWTGV